MALINCPECGRKNISDAAESCPNCGYAVRAYFSNKRTIETKNKLEEAQKRVNRKKMDAEIKALDNLMPMEEPQKPNCIKYYFYHDNSLSLLSWALIIAVVLFLLCFVSTFIFSFLLAVTLVVGLPLALYVTYLSYDSAVTTYRTTYKEWEAQQTNWETYIEKKKREIKTKYDEKEREIEKSFNTTIAHNSYKPTSQQSNALKCPICGSTDISKISTLNRTASVAAWGLASGKIGKQYECRKCKHKW